MGSIKFQNLNNLSRLIWQWCEKQRIWFFAPYIKPLDNVEADFESRRLSFETEWKL